LALKGVKSQEFCENIKFLDELNVKYVTEQIANLRKFLAMAQLVEAVRYNPEGRGSESRWRHWNFLLP
jgi:hypothetical protein